MRELVPPYAGRSLPSRSGVCRSGGPGAAASVGAIGYPVRRDHGSPPCALSETCGVGIRFA